MKTYKIINKNGLSDQQIHTAFKKGLQRYKLKNKKVIVLIPDSTRSGPYYFLVRCLAEILKPIVNKIDFLIALGTHPLMTQEEIDKFLHISNKDKQGVFKDVHIFNHLWNKPSTFVKIGEFSRKAVEDISDGLFSEEVPIEINKLIFNYDVIMVLGPVFPHEVVGFSGGVKYLFPGICGWELLNFFHWFGAVLTNLKINGVIDTPIRTLIEKANEFIRKPEILIALDLTGNDVHGIFIGNIIKAWQEAAGSSARSHIVRLEKQYSTVLGIVPDFYNDLWTAGKVMYKLESIVRDRGELIIYAPHIDEISYTHGQLIKTIGYHTRDYFLKQMDKFKNIPRGILAHSTHVKGIGTFENKVEKPRITVTLATRIPEKLCRKINLNYRDPMKIDVREWEKRQGVLVIHRAGEILYQYKNRK